MRSAPFVSMEPADRVVSHYFFTAHQAVLRANAAQDDYEANADRLSALFALLAGFEAFLNCYFRILADELDEPRRSRIIAMISTRNGAIVAA